MQATEVMSRLQALGSEKLRAMNSRNGAGDNQFGVKMGDIRQIAKEIKTDATLAAELWETGNVEARLLAVLIMRPKDLPADRLQQMVLDAEYRWLADWLTSYVVKSHPEKELLRGRWMQSKEPMLARAGWSLTTERVAKNSDGLDLTSLLNRIESEMLSAPEPTQWTMNACLAEIGISCPQLRDRALSIGHKLGVYKDYPCSKGCTSPFAPIWIAEMVKRQG